MGWRSGISLSAALLAIVGCTSAPTPERSAASSPTRTEQTAATGATASATAGPTPSATSTASPASASGRIAFVRGAHAGGPHARRDLWLVDIASRAEHQLTNDDRFEGNPVWLVDGSRLAFSWYLNPDPYHETLTSILPDGMGRMDLGPVQTVYSMPAISPDGRTVAYGGDGTEGASSGIVLLDLATGSRRMLSHDGETDPLWSPDGGKLVAYLPSRRVVVFDARTGAAIASIVADVQGLLGWSSDGASIIYVFCGATKADCGPWTATADGKAPQPYPGAIPPQAPRWLSPDRTWMATVDDDGQSGIPGLRVGHVGGNAVRVSGNLVVGTASWSPDGEWLAFDAATPDNIAVSRIYVVSRNGGTPIAVSAGPADAAPAWQP